VKVTTPARARRSPAWPCRQYRTEYLRLQRAGLATLASIGDAEIEDIARPLGDSDVRAKAIREMVRRQANSD